MKTIALVLLCFIAVIADQRLLTDSERQTVIDKLNEVRRRVALGQTVGKDGTALPTAANMRQIEFNSDLETAAFNWVSQCNFGYASGTTQLIGAWSGMPDDFAKVVSDTIEQWYNNSQTFDQDVTNFQSGSEFFTELVWSTNYLAGCAVGQCETLVGQSGNNWDFVACNFNSGANNQGRPIYIPGKPCSICPYGTRCNNSLCATDSQLPARSAGWLSVVERYSLLNTLNQHRRDLANGKLTDGNGNTLPTGNNIMEIVYDTELETIAANNFTQCTSGFGDLDDYNVNSIMMTGVETPDGQDYPEALKAAVNYWWAPTNYKDSVSNYQGSESSFAKLAWAKTSRIGCSREICLYQGQNINVTKVVCVLGEEKGAITGQALYLSGFQCSNCISGYSCNYALCSPTVSTCTV